MTSVFILERFKSVHTIFLMLVWNLLIGIAIKNVTYFALRNFNTKLFSTFLNLEIAVFMLMKRDTCVTEDFYFNRLND